MAIHALELLFVSFACSPNMYVLRCEMESQIKDVMYNDICKMYKYGIIFECKFVYRANATSQDNQRTKNRGPRWKGNSLMYGFNPKRKIFCIAMVCHVV